MFGIRYLKVPPTTHVIHYRRGRVVCQGPGLSFFYFAPNSVIAHIPAGSTDVPFVFEEVTGDFQDATIQGQITCRVIDPAKLAGLLDHSVDGRGRYLSDDPSKVAERLIHAMQILTRSFTQTRTLHELLMSSEILVTTLLDGLRSSETVAMLGLQVLSVSILSIKAAPEMAKALQADARESLLRKADQALYERRNAVVEMERRIKENELNTEIAVQQKRRQVRETQMSADIAVEEQRAALVDQRVQNQRKEAEARGEALRATLEPLRGLDWRTLLAAAGNLGPKQLIALAFHDLADNAGKIGRLNISPDLLESLLQDDYGAIAETTPAPRESRQK